MHNVFDHSNKNIIFYIKNKDRIGLDLLNIDEVVMDSCSLNGFNFFYVDQGHPKGGVVLLITDLVGNPDNLSRILEQEKDDVKAFEQKWARVNEEGVERG